MVLPTGRKKRTSGMAAEASAIKSFCYVFFNLIKSYCPGNAACQVREKHNFILYQNLIINKPFSEMEENI